MALGLDDELVLELAQARRVGYCGAQDGRDQMQVKGQPLKAEAGTAAGERPGL